MFKRNWSIWLLLALTLGLILTQYFSGRIARDERISIEDARAPDVVLGVTKEQDKAYVWEEVVGLSIDENLYHALDFNGTAYYVTAVNQLREQYTYTYRLYRYGTDITLVSELPDAKPHRLSIVAADQAAILMTKEYSDGKTALVSFVFQTGELHTISQWDGMPSRAQISYYQNTVSLVVGNTWGIFNLQGNPRTVEKRLPGGAYVKALASGQSHALIYYEVDELRYMMQYQFSTKKVTTWLVNDQVKRIAMQAGWAITQSDKGLQLYTWPKLSVQRLQLEGTLHSFRVINERLVDIRLVGARHHPFIFDMSTRAQVFNQQADPFGEPDETIYYYYAPVVTRINRLHFVK